MPSTKHQTPMRILIIEDEPAIALDLQDLLEDAGFKVVGVAGRLDRAMTLIEGVGFDAAVVDANLGGASSSPAALELTARNLPFIVLTGYSLRQQGAAFSQAVFIQKPCRPEQLINALLAIRARQP